MQSWSGMWEEIEIRQSYQELVKCSCKNEGDIEYHECVYKKRGVPLGRVGWGKPPRGKHI